MVGHDPSERTSQENHDNPRVRPRSRSSSIHSTEDPLSFAIRPSESETPEEREERLSKEAEAKRISDLIDEELRVEAERIRKRKATGEVKLLLLGQAESGKSTLQKQFQLMHAPASLDSERSSWAPVVYMNVIKAVRMVLDALGSSPAEATPSGTSENWQLANVRLRLAALVGMENSLMSRLSQAGGVSLSDGKGRLFVRKGWQKIIKSQVSGKTTQDQTTSEEPVLKMLVSSKDDIKELWRNSQVRELLAPNSLSKRRLRLEDSAEFFLNDIDRIASADYLPSMDDIMRARIQTMGIAEHEFEIALGPKAVRWLLYDVGGARGQRHRWVPYFDDANAIIFLAPISAFDQYLDEDPKINRIDDSLQLFTQICGHPLLKKVHMVLFLNKTDILKSKLQAGIPLSRYITSYGSRSNTYEDIANYFKAHFAQVHRRSNEMKRVLYIHMTSVVDTKATQQIIANVRDSIFRGYLKDAALV